MIPDLPVADIQGEEVCRQLRRYFLPVHNLWMTASQWLNRTVPGVLALFREIYTSKLPGLA